ncbi:MAG: polysaccharide biosynthesis tyrosine autokinase [Bacteroidota bacterium]
MTDDLFQYSQKKQAGITPREVVFKYIRYIPWVIISLALMLTLAWIKLRYSTNIFSISGKLLVKKNSNPYSSGGGSGSKFDDIFMMQGSSSSLNDEIEVIRSRYMAARVIRSLGLQTQYYNKGKIKTPSVIHPKDLPFAFEIQEQKDSLSAFSLLVTIISQSQFYLDESKTLHNFNEYVNLPIGKIKLSLTNRSLALFASNEFIISYQPLESAAASLSSSISVGQSTDFVSNVLIISYQTENTRMGIDIVDQFMEEYQKFTLEDKKQILVNTLSFIDEQMKGVKSDLGTVEHNLQGFREQNRVISPEIQSQLFINNLSESDKELSAQEVKVSVLDLLSRYITSQENPYRTVTSTLGITEPTLLQQVTEYNKLQVERENVITTTPLKNPYIKSLETSIEKLRVDILENLRNIRKTYQLSIANIKSKNKEMDNQVMSIPGKEKQLLEVTRQQKILEELYSFLLQKKLETSISSASTISNIKVLEPAMAGGEPMAPNRRSTYITFLFLGLIVPMGVISLMEYLNDKVKTKADIEKLTETPVLGEIGHAEEGGALVVTANNRQYIAEQFRILRSNLQYILPKTDKPVMMVTSSFSGEGKSFVSTNLGAVLAISGKRTVILEFDIRKPKVLHGLGLSERRGLTNYIVGNLNINEIIYPVPTVENLFVVPCGPVPPNPAEMLLDEKVGLLFAELRKQFDAVIVDTAPVGLVSDAITLGSHANAAIYIVRHNYTYKKQVGMIDELYKHKKLPHMAIIINDINAKGGYGGYYGYGSQGYSYGYGYGAGYFEAENKRKAGFFTRVKKWFS